ncbi:hypothetical protein [Bowmanella yangjiangensis]|uniref:Uncharacterized protein n=1 Tax=Bowmanella yangjiangensis TaxID=2811230 RepID=A0ABS3CRW4_9ALTE|nr:hypothetical protein [Bowmanella yangjiangensis]MBN7818394.1 hypothetical protein [Bowmanella yangjiangensis]
MNTLLPPSAGLPLDGHFKHSALICFTLIVCMACSGTLPVISDVTHVKQRLNSLKVNNRISSLANPEFDAAFAAVRALEQNDGRDPQQFQYLLWMAEHKIELADIVSRTHYLQYQRTSLMELLDDLQRKTLLSNFGEETLSQEESLGKH